MLAQSMVAAPLWTAANAMPEGEGFAGERAKQGYMLLMNVAIRPILLVIGFVLAMGMVWASTWMSQQLMTTALKSMISSQDLSPVTSDGGYGDVTAFFINGLTHVLRETLNNSPLPRNLRDIDEASQQTGLLLINAERFE